MVVQPWAGSTCTSHSRWRTHGAPLPRLPGDVSSSPGAQLLVPVAAYSSSAESAEESSRPLLQVASLSCPGSGELLASTTRLGAGLSVRPIGWGPTERAAGPLSAKGRAATAGTSVRATRRGLRSAVVGTLGGAVDEAPEGWLGAGAGAGSAGCRGGAALASAAASGENGAAPALDDWPPATGL